MPNRARFLAVATASIVLARVDRHGDATLRFRLPERKGEFPTRYVGRPRFSGTRLVGRGRSRYLSFYDVNDRFEGHVVAVVAEKRCQEPRGPT